MAGNFCGVAGTPAARRGWGCVSCAHILNLIVKDRLNQVDSTLEKIRDIAYNINCSQAKHELFFYCCKIVNMKRKNISFDIPTI